MTRRIRFRSIASVALAGLSFLLVPSAHAQGDAQRGAKAFQICAACHSLEPGRNLTGPSLANLFGRKAGTAPGFLRYSDALKRSGVEWNPKTLDAWLRGPEKFIPGNDMTFPGITDPKVRADIIAYLQAVSAGNAPSSPAAQGGMMGMMGGGRMPGLKQAGADSVVMSIRHCGDTYFVTTADGKTHKVWEFNMRFKTDTGDSGPNSGKPVLVGVGMRGDRAAVVFSSPVEFGNFIKQQCD